MLGYDGELTCEALALIDLYVKNACSPNKTARQWRELTKQRKNVAQYFRQPMIRELFLLKLLEKGVTIDKIAETINDGLSAMRGIYFEGDKVADEPNYDARFRFAQLAGELYGVLKYNTKVNIDHDNKFVIVDRREKEVIPSE